METRQKADWSRKAPSVCQ